MTQLIDAATLALSALGPWAPLLFVVVYIIATVGFFPGLVLSMAGGAMFGVVWGTIYVFIGASVGSILAFVIGRRLAHDRVSSWIARDARWTAIGEAIRSKGLLVVFLLRLSPAVPYNVLNYALGVTDVRLKHYVAGSVGMVPSIVLYTYSGRVIGDVAGVVAGRSTPKGPAYYTLLTVGLAATALVTVVITRAAHTALTARRVH